MIFNQCAVTIFKTCNTSLIRNTDLFSHISIHIRSQWLTWMTGCYDADCGQQTGSIGRWAQLANLLQPLLPSDPAPDGPPLPQSAHNPSPWLALPPTTCSSSSQLAHGPIPQPTPLLIGHPTLIKGSAGRPTTHGTSLRLLAPNWPPSPQLGA